MVYYRTVRLADTDAAGVIYFTAVLSLCHEAYEASLEGGQIDLKAFFRDTNLAIPIVHGEVDFFSPVFCGDQLEVHLAAQTLRDSEFEVDYQVFRVGDSSQCVAKAKTRHVCINPRTRCRQPLSEDMVKWLSSVRKMC